MLVECIFNKENEKNVYIIIIFHSIDSIKQLLSKYCNQEFSEMIACVWISNSRIVLTAHLTRYDILSYTQKIQYLIY